MKTLSQLVIERLKKTPKQFVFGGTLERDCCSFHKPSTVSRLLREMAEENIIYKDYEKVGKVTVVKYKYKK